MPLRTTGVGLTLDISHNIAAAVSPRGNPDDLRDFFQATGPYGSILEHKVPEDLGYYSVSTIRVLSEALRRGIPVLKIDAASREALLPRLDLDRLTTQAIEAALDAGLNVTVHVEPIQIGDWRGVGFITQDPESGTGGYYLSGGLAGEVRLIEGGAITSELTTIAAYGVLILSAALGLWTLSSALAIGGVLGSLFFAAAFLGLAFDVLDLFRLTSGELSPEDYLVEMAVGLLLEAGLGGLGEVLRRVGVGNLSKSVIERVVRQLDEWTGGITAQLRRTCAYAADSVPQQICPGLSAEEIVKYSQFVTTKGAWESLAGLSELITSRGGNGGAAVRRLLRNKEALKGGSDRIEAIARIILDAPKVPGFDEVVERALDQNRGFPYELRRAIALHDPENGVEWWRMGVPSVLNLNALSALR